MPPLPANTFETIERARGHVPRGRARARHLRRDRHERRHALLSSRRKQPARPRAAAPAAPPRRHRGSSAPLPTRGREKARGAAFQSGGAAGPKDRVHALAWAFSARRTPTQCLLPYLRHSFWFLPEWSARHAMANLLNEKHNVFWHANRFGCDGRCRRHRAVAGMTLECRGKPPLPRGRAPSTSSGPSATLSLRGRGRVAAAGAPAGDLSWLDGALNFIVRFAGRETAPSPVSGEGWALVA